MKEFKTKNLKKIAPKCIDATFQPFSDFIFIGLVLYLDLQFKSSNTEKSKKFPLLTENEESLYFGTKKHGDYVVKLRFFNKKKSFLNLCGRQNHKNKL